MVVKTVDSRAVHLAGRLAEMKVVLMAVKMVEYLVGKMVDPLVVKRVGN